MKSRVNQATVHDRRAHPGFVNIVRTTPIKVRPTVEFAPNHAVERTLIGRGGRRFRAERAANAKIGGSRRAQPRAAYPINRSLSGPAAPPVRTRSSPRYRR